MLHYTMLGVFMKVKDEFSHSLYGLVPPHWVDYLADDIITVTDNEVLEMTKRISSEQGLYVGYSSGANVIATLKYTTIHLKIKNIVTILCDTGYKYSDL